jgi:hypothetical protein
VFDKNVDRLQTSLTSCTGKLISEEQNLLVELSGGLFKVWGAGADESEPPLELYSVPLNNRATSHGSSLVGFVQDPGATTLATAASFGRHYADLAVTLWDLESRRQFLEVYVPAFEWSLLSQPVTFTDGGRTLEICHPDLKLLLDVDPVSWRREACKIAGRNLTGPEWRYFMGDNEPEKTCAQWPEGD